MKFCATVSFKGERDAESLIRAFFNEFNSKNSITINGKEALIEVFFEDPPKQIINSICECKVVKFEFGQTFTSVRNNNTAEEPEGETSDEDEETEPEEETSDEDEETEPEEETSDEDEETEPEGETSDEDEETEPEGETADVAEESEPKKDSANKAKPKDKQKSNQIPELIEISMKSNSYKEFVDSVKEWLELDKRAEYFESLLKAAEKLEKINWKEIEVILKNNKINYSAWDKIWCTKQVAAKFKDSKNTVSILELIKAITEYKTFDFNNKVGIATEVEEISATKNRIKMECIPEIASFEEKLGNIANIHSVEERVRYVLNAMGLEKKTPEERNAIIEIANVAVKLEKIDPDTIFLKANIQMESSIAWMTFSKFLNDFVMKYNSNKRVKLTEFLGELRDIVVFNNEI